MIFFIVKPDISGEALIPGGTDMARLKGSTQPLQGASGTSIKLFGALLSIGSGLWIARVIFSLLVLGAAKVGYLGTQSSQIDTSRTIDDPPEWPFTFGSSHKRRNIFGDLCTQLQLLRFR